MTASAASAPAPSAPAPTVAPAVAAAPSAAPAIQFAQALGTSLVPTGPQAPTAGADRVPTGPQVQTAVGPSLGRIAVIEPPGPGEAKSVQVFPGMRVVLQDPVFDGARSLYLVQGDDLVVRTPNTGVVLLIDFFRTDGSQASLAAAGGPTNASGQLLSLAYLEGNETLIKPGAGPSGPQAPTGGNASFSPYFQGEIGAGLDPLGPLGPTDSLGRLLEPLLDPLDDDGGAGGDDDGGGGGNKAPVVTTISEIKATIADNSVGYNPGAAKPLPTLTEGQAIDESKVNGVNPNLVTIDQTREVSVVFQSELAALKNTLIAYFVSPDGTIGAARVVFPDVNDFGTEPFYQDGSGPLTAGATVSLGLVEKGLQVGLALIQGGWDIHGGLLEFGTIEIRDPVTGGPFNILTSEGLPLIVHTKPNGIESIIYGKPFWTVDPDPSTPNVNELNFDGLGHVVSGWDPVRGDLTVAFEDVGRPVGEVDDTPNGDIYSDRDFNDAIFGVHFGPSVAGETLFLGDSSGSLLAQITDKDSTSLKSATVAIASGAKAGDVLALGSLGDSDGDGLVDGTSIAVIVESDTSLRLEGKDSIANYELVLNDVRYTNESGDIAPGIREIEVTATDDKGKTSDTATTSFDVADDQIVLTSGNDFFEGTDAAEAIAGGNGEDVILGLGGNDLLNGGDGNDYLDGGDGDDQLRGLSGQDSLTGGPGADIFVSTALSDGRDEVNDFNLDDGDKFDLEGLLAGTAFDPTAPDADQWIRFVATDFDGGGVQNDLAVQVDRDGAGTGYEFVTMFAAFNPVGLDRITIDSATTFGNAA